MYYLKYFFLTSIIGFIIESFVYGNYFGNSGILYGPWTIVYGFGSILILLINEKTNQKINNPILKVLIIFIVSALLLTMLELIGGIFIEKIFNIIFWDYSDCKYNIGKYICLEMSILWGFSALAFIYLLKPLLDKTMKYISDFFTYILLFIMSCDLILTIILK